MFRADSKERVPDERFRGMNPAFVKSVWAKRGTRRERVRKCFVAAEERLPDAIDIMLKRAVEKYGVIQTPRQRLRSDIDAVARMYRLTYSDLTKGSSNDIVRARSAAMWMLKFSRGMTLPEIGRHFNMDHTGVLAGIKRHVARMDPNSPEALWIERKREKGRENYSYCKKTDRHSQAA